MSQMKDYLNYFPFHVKLKAKMTIILTIYDDEDNRKNVRLSSYFVNPFE